MDEEHLEELIEEATMDCYDKHEQFAGFEATLTDQLPFPFSADALGDTVQVTGISQKSSPRTGIYVTIDKDGKQYDHPLFILDNVQLDEETAAWITAYKMWAD